MKKFILICGWLLAVLPSQAQTDHSGAYGYSFKPVGEPPETEKNNGPAGNLVLLKMEGNTYRFWLDITLGWPNYHVGETDGTITFINDTASFNNSYEDALHPCILKFKISGTTIYIDSRSTSFNCGFGNGVNADGEYARLKTQPVFNNDWLRKEYRQSPLAMITAGRADIFKDEKCLHPYVPKKYFIKNDRIPSIAETDKSIYTEYISADGKFIYGWVKKSALEIVKE